MRGKVSAQTADDEYPGITPAYAGKSTICDAFELMQRDHPRVCGEKGITLIPLLSGLGSPPRVRGKENPSVPKQDSGGITPACAGKSVFCLSWRFLALDHPRVCGEKKEKIWKNGFIQGSPPRVRGKACSSKICR